MNTGILKRSLACLLFICMLFTMMPAEYMGVVFANNNTVGTANNNSGGFKGLNNMAGGTWKSNSCIFRVVLSRNPENFLNGTPEVKAKVESNYKTKWPSDSDLDNNTLFLWNPDAWDWTRFDGTGGYYEDKGVAQYEDGTIRYYFGDYKGLNFRLENPYDTRNVPENVIKKAILNAYDNKQISDISDLANYNWTSYLPSDTYNYAIEVLSYVFDQIDVNSNLESGYYKIDERVNEFINEGSDPNSKAKFGIDPKEMSHREKLEVAAGYVSFLMVLYSLPGAYSADQNPVLANVAGNFETAINDYCSNSNIEEKPVSIVIDTAAPMTNTTDKFMFSIPTFDYIHFSILSTPEEMLTTVGNISGAASPGNTKQQITNMMNSSITRWPLSMTYAGDVNSSIQRIADDYLGNNEPVRESALGHAYSAIFMEDSYIRNTANNVSDWYRRGFHGFLDYIHFNDTGIKGFMILGHHVANPLPTASFQVDGTLETAGEACGDLVRAEGAPKLSVNISGNDALVSSLNARANNDNFEGMKIESEIFRTVSVNGKLIEDGSYEGFIVGNYETDDSGIRGLRMPEMEEKLNRVLKGDDLIAKVSENKPIEIEDTSIYGKDFKRPVTGGGDAYCFTYYVNLKISLDNATGDPGSANPAYYFNSNDIVSKGEDGVMYNMVELFVPKQVTTIEEAPDIEIIKPDSPDTTEIVNPSDDENLRDNTQMLRRFSFVSTGEEFAEIKSKYPLQEEYEVMGGIPSSEEIYFSVGGSEYKLAIIMQYWMNEHSRDRTYTIHFDGNKCEYNNEGEGTGDRMPETFPIAQPAYGNGAYTDKSVHCFNENHTGDFDEVIVAEWSGNDKATCVPQYFSCNCGTQLHSHHSLTTPTYDAALADANRLVAELNAEDVVWTSASDKLERKQKWTAIITTDKYDWSDTTIKGGTGKWCGSHGHSSGTHGSGENSYSCGSGSHSTGSACANKHEWHIVVTATIPKHSVCGPCCGHHMPELWDTWRQGLVYDFAKISQVRLFKLDQGSVDGLQELTGVDTVFANVVSGNPTYFMNIAQMTEKRNKNDVNILPVNYDKTLDDNNGGDTGANLTQASLLENVITYYSGNNRKAAQSSRAGRLRYILDPDHAQNDTISYDEEGDGSGGSYTIDYNLVAAPNQHDDVYYHAGTRSTNCDGMATSGNFGKNLSDVLPENQSTKIGHENEWADGCLYTNVMGKTVQAGITGFTANSQAYSDYWDPAAYPSGNFVHNTATDYFLYKNDEYVSQYKEDYNHHIHREDSVAGVANAQWNGNTVKVAYSDAADIRDMDTPEWQFFDKARRTKIVANVISDFLILQTSGGDQSIFYYEEATEPTEAQQHFDKVISHNEELFRDNPLSIFTGDLACKDAVHVKPEISANFIMVGGYNGLYNQPTEKYRPYSPSDKTTQLKDFMDGNWSTYDATKKEGTYNHLGNSGIKTIFDEDPAKTINRPERQATGQDKSFKVLQDSIQILPTAENQVYTPYNAKVFYSQVVGFYSIDGGAWDIEKGDDDLVTTLSNVKIGWEQITKHGEMYKKYWGNKNGVDNATQYYRLPSGDKNSTTVNSLVVFTPVSTEDAMVMEQDKLDINGKKISRDQRANVNEYPDMNDLVNKLKVCPLDPEFCEYRKLDCKFYKDRTLAEFDFEGTYQIEERVYAADGSSKVELVTKDGTRQENGRWITVNKINGIEYTLPSGFSIGSSGKVGSGDYLVADGTRWNIPFSDIGLTSARSNRLRVEMDLTVESTASNLMLVGFRDYGFVINKGKTIENNDKSFNSLGSFIQKSKTYTDSIGPRYDILKESNKGYNKVHLSITFGFNNIVDCKVKIDGVEVADKDILITEYRDVWADKGDGTRVLASMPKKIKDVNNVVERFIGANGEQYTGVEGPIDLTQTDPPDAVTTGDIGENLTIGSWIGSEGYQAEYYIDNLKIILDGGHDTHDSTCYERIQTHATSMIHTHTDACHLESDLTICDGALNAGYACNGVKNQHTHNSTCYTNVSNNTIKLNNSASTSKKFLAKTSGTLTLAGYGSCTAETWTANVKVNGVQKYNYSSYYAGSFTYNFSAGDIVEFTASIQDSCGVGWNISWTSGSFGEMTGNCTGNLNSHTHTGVSGKDYPNGCYDIATKHRHDNPPILCGKNNVVGSHIHTDACLGSKISEVKKDDYTQYTYKRLTCTKTENDPGNPTTYTYVKDKIYTVDLSPGEYKLEVWGAQGGNSSYGGLGGYAVGTLELKTSDKVYVVVGGQGGAGTQNTSTTTNGGYNGGGYSVAYGSGGGGATHIGLKSGLLTAFKNDYSTQLLLVAGGGGGWAGTGSRSGGYGGGTTGGTGYSGCGGPGYGGSQSGGGETGRNGTAASFGQGGSQTAFGNNGGAGGGGGFYGGGAGGNDYSSYRDNDDSGGGGGSGYVNTTKLINSPKTVAGNSSFPNTSGSGNETGHSGNGYAKITPLKHTHVDGECYTQVTFNGCKFLAEGTLVCTGELNTKTDYNVHAHTRECLEGESAVMEPKMLRHTGTYQTYIAPWEDEYTIQVWGAEYNGRTGYAEAKVRLKSGQRLYAYVGGEGNNGFNGGRSDIRLQPLPSGTVFDGDVPQADNAVELSEETRLLSAGKNSTDVNTFVSDKVASCVMYDKYIGVKGGDGGGRILITPTNESHDILENILAGNYTEEENRMYLGDELADKIYSGAKSFKTWDSWSVFNTKGVTPYGDEYSDTHIMFSNNNIIYNVRKNTPEFYIPVSLEAKTLRQVKVTLDNNTSSTSAKLYANSVDESNAITSTITANTSNQEITFMIGNKWDALAISKLYFDLSVGTTSGSIVVKKIELLGQAASVTNIDDVTYQNSSLLNLNNFSNSDTKGFTALTNAELSYSSGKMNVKHTSSSPTIKWGNLTKINTSAIEYIKLKVQTTNTSSSNGYLYYGGSTSGNKMFYWYMGSSSYGEQTIYIDVNSKFSYNETTGQYYNSTGSWWSNWTGDITDIRFQFSNGSGHTTTVSSIEFIGQGITSGTGGYSSQLSSSSGTVFNFGYSNSIQNKTLYPGKYKLEVWGAQGSNSSYGGKGGYGYGTLTLTEKTTLYIVTGGQGNGSGGYNGGGSGDHGQGGGATHIALRSGLLSTLSAYKDTDILIVAGGGGGYGQRGSGGSGGGVNLSGSTGGSGCGQPGGGGTLEAGGTNSYSNVSTSYNGVRSYNGSFGKGGSGTRNSAGGGGGYYGGAASYEDYHNNDLDDAGGGGGSGYAHPTKITGASGTSGNWTGDGKARITALENIYEIVASPVTITSNITTKKYLTATYFDPFKEVGTREFILTNWELIPNRIDGGYHNPIWKCKFKDLNKHQCTGVNDFGITVEYCKNYVVFNCTEPHHRGEHYPGANAICWSACGDDSKHVNTKKETTGKQDEVVRLADFLQLDSAFTVYFPNIGDFEGNNAHGLASPQITRGKGYSDRMDTTRWTREKRVKFPFDVIYDNKETDKFETYFGGTWIELDVETEYFNFYLPVSNFEYSNARVQFEVEAINCGTSAGLEPKRNIKYPSTINTDYADKLKTFKAGYIGELLKAIQSGYKVPYTTSQQANETKGKLFDENAYWNFYTLKATNLEKKLKDSIKNTDALVESSFEGNNGEGNDYVYPHYKYGSKTSGGINWKVKTLTANDNKVRVNNRMRSNALESLHGGYKSFYLDVIGRIGNFSITDTDDFRFSNFFKVPIMSKEEAMKDANAWLVEGLVLKVDEGKQNYYIGDTYDIRGTQISQTFDNNNTLDINKKVDNGGLPKTEGMRGNNSEIKWLDTYNTQSWMRGMYTGTGKIGRDTTKPNLVSQILTAEVNNIDILKDEELRYGYDIYNSIVTIGEYMGAKVQVIPKYYALKLSSGPADDFVPENEYKPIVVGEYNYYPVDVYINKDGVYSPVNVHNNANNANTNIKNVDLYNYVFNLDWTNEAERRNYTIEEKSRTEQIQKRLSNIVRDIPEDTGGFIEDFEDYPIVGENKIDIPTGRNNYLGTSQYILMDGKHRTFIGTEYSFGSNYYESNAGATYWGANKNPNDILPSNYYEQNVQRWHGKLGIPSSSVFVPSGKQVNSETTKLVMNDDYAIICTAEIIAIGPIWSLYYSQPWFTSMQINGKTYGTGNHYPGHRSDDGSVACSNCLPPIIAVYSSDDSSVSDVEIVQTH